MFSVRRGIAYATLGAFWSLGMLFAAFFTSLAYIVFLFLSLSTVLFFVLASQRLSAGAKFWASVFLYFSFAYLNMSNAGLTDFIVRLHFFNYFFSLPFSYVSGVEVFSSGFSGDVLDSLISAESLFWTAHTPFLVLYVCIGYTYIALFVLHRSAPGAPAPQPPAEFHLPKWLFVAGVALFVVCGLAGYDFALSRSLWLVSMAFFAVGGFGFINRLLPGTSGLISVLVAFSLPPFVPEVMWLLAIIGGLDALLGLRRFLPPEAAGPTEKPAGAKSFSTFISIAVVLLAAVMVVSFFALRMSRSPAAPERVEVPEVKPHPDVRSFVSEEAGDEVFISGPGLSFYIDRYEYPNRRGAAPAVGLPPGAARDRCAMEGKRLCTITEWSVACRAGENNFAYYLSVYPGEARSLVETECSWKRGVVSPSGSFPECRNPYGIFDMFGNVWEWVEFPGSSTAAGIVGPASIYGCERCRKCEWVVVPYEDQIESLPLGRIGFRCCRD